MQPSLLNLFSFLYWSQFCINVWNRFTMYYKYYRKCMFKANFVWNHIVLKTSKTKQKNKKRTERNECIYSISLNLFALLVFRFRYIHTTVRRKKGKRNFFLTNKWQHYSGTGTSIKCRTSLYTKSIHQIYLFCK